MCLPSLCNTCEALGTTLALKNNYCLLSLYSVKPAWRADFPSSSQALFSQHHFLCFILTVFYGACLPDVAAKLPFLDVDNRLRGRGTDTL